MGSLVEWKHKYKQIMHKVNISAVVDKRFVDKIGNKTAILRIQHVNKDCFVDIIMYYFEKERIYFKNKI